uniref:SAC domain-containing protein n=1 Tax=Meloidogyne floridensis TaxID=298350 RepID=A0A915P0R5_9BILA
MDRMDRVYSLSVYETPTHFYIIGSDATESIFRTLKIDRITQNEFIVGEPNHDYSKADIGELLATVSSSSIVTPTEKWGRKRNSTVSTGGGLLRTLEKACGLIGAVRFLHGYYLLLVSKAKQICQIGNHSIFKVEDVSMIYLPSTSTPLPPEEQRYAKLFQTVDFTTNFYFSYTYKLSRTLQENSLAEKGIKWNKNNYKFNMKSEQKFVWNDFLLEPFRKSRVNRKWYLELVHGYIGHQLVELPCAKFDLILLARRSAEFAGTRFLKRGTNYKGAVANDVETEQIVWEVSNSGSLNSGKFSAFVQRRGSVPLFWSQDSMHRGAPMVVGKPPIVIDRVEPNALTTAIHFQDLRRKYGHPIIVLNLVKRMEQKHNENLLHDNFCKTIQYLNQFRHSGHCIDYISFDVSRCNKTGRVLQQLDRLGQRVVLATGWFQNFPSLKFRDPSNLNSIPFGAEDIVYRFEPEMSSDNRMLLQHGIVRSNCVDCLDRTNVAQFGLGKAALCWQLFSMGLLDCPSPQSLNNEFCRSFEELYDEHGDTLAWQYAGSQLVHSIKTYKRTAVFQERSRDVLQTLSRYYSNTFSDFEKQDGINLFLGTYRLV